MARKSNRRMPALSGLVGLSFREELHAIEAVIAGQGVAICSDVLVGQELAQGSLIRLSNISVPGFGFHLTYRPNHPKELSIMRFLSWARAQIG